MRKILVACIGTNLGGIERSLIEFLKYITEQDCEVDLIHWRKPGVLYKEIPSKVNILNGLCPLDFADIIRQKKPNVFIKHLMWRLNMKFAKLFRGGSWKTFKKVKKHYDVAISYCQNGYSPYYIIDKVDADKKYLWYHHGSYERHGKVYRTDKEYYSRYNSIIAVSDSCKEMLKEFFPNCNIDVVQNIINVKEICMKAEEPINDMPKTATHTFVTVSRYSYEKGIDVAIETARCLKEKGVSFCWYFIGEGPYHKEAEILIVKYELQNQCILLGGKENPYPYIKNADIYVQPSRVESYGISVVEAIILGKAIVATNIPALANVTENGRLAICIDLSVVEFAHTIEKLCIDSNERKTLEGMVQLGNIGNQKTHVKINELLGL